jgi:hypothetical protein
MNSSVVVPKELLITNYKDLVTPLAETGDFQLKDGSHDHLVVSHVLASLEAFTKDNEPYVPLLPDDMIIGISIVDSDIYTLKSLRNSVNNEPRIDDSDRAALIKDIFSLMIQSMRDNSDSPHPATLIEENFSCM